MKYTRRYQAALKAVDDFVGARNHYEELQAYLRALGWAEREVDDRAEKFSKEFSEVSGAQTVLNTMDADDDMPAPPPIILSASLIEETIAAERDLTKQKRQAFDSIRDSERFKQLIDTRDVLVVEMRASRRECFEREDHPLIAVRRQPQESWLTQLDARNYDAAAATTLEDKARVEKNIRELAADDADRKRVEEREAQQWAQRMKEARERRS